MAGAMDSNRQNAVRIRHIPIQNEGDGGLFASLHDGQVGAQETLSDSPIASQLCLLCFYQNLKVDTSGRITIQSALDTQLGPA